MCSNTNSTRDVGDDGDYATHILKRPKRQRVPKRGPGVAELEKILREQETKVINADNGNVPFVPDPHNTYHFSPSPPPMTMVYGNKTTFSGSCGNGGNNGTGIARSGIILPEEALLPTSIYEEAPKMLDGYPISTSFLNGSDQMHMLQKNQYSIPYPFPTINLFPQYGSLPSPENQSTAGFYVHEEPPSNQRSLHQHYSSMLPEEEKMVGTMQAGTFSMENTSGSGTAPPITHCQASSPFAYIQALDQSTSFSNHNTRTGFNLQLDETFSRRNYGVMNGNFLIFGSPATPSSLMTQNSQQEFSKYRSLPFQKSSVEGSDSHQKKKPFYSFLKPEEQTRREELETTLCLNNERPIRDTIDLNLKL